MNVLHCQGFQSHVLNKRFMVDFFIPDRLESCTNFLMMNDGQMSGDLQLFNTLNRFEQEGLLVFTASIHASAERLQEYGVKSWPDYRQRGSRALEYEQFITAELLPFIRSSFKFNYKPERSVYAGYSLGALSAFKDIVWENPNLFSKLGAFSGSFWWRSQAFSTDNPDGHRIMHQKIEQATKKDGIKFWFQAGTEDEKSDRNNIGVIDVIDDINDLMHRLQLLGYDPKKDMYYHEMHGGRHEPQTWAIENPDRTVVALRKLSRRHLIDVSPQIKTVVWDQPIIRSANCFYGCGTTALIDQIEIKSKGQSYRCVGNHRSLRGDMNSNPRS